MSATSSARMVHRCQLQRDSLIGRRDEGDVQYTDNGTPVMCFLWAQAGREAVDPEKVVVTEDLRALLPLTVDVTILDQIHGVKDRLGADIDTRKLLIQTILRRSDHFEVVLEVVQN